MTETFEMAVGLHGGLIVTWLFIVGPSLVVLISRLVPPRDAVSMKSAIVTVFSLSGTGYLALFILNRTAEQQPYLNYIAAVAAVAAAGVGYAAIRKRMKAPYLRVLANSVMVGFFCATWWNWIFPDRALSRDAESFMQIAEDKEPASNMLYAVMGFGQTDSTTGDAEYGVQVSQISRDFIRRGDWSGLEAYQTEIFDSDFPVFGNFKKRDQDFLNRLDTNRASFLCPKEQEKIRSLFQQNQDAIERYLSLQRFSRWHTPFPLLPEMEDLRLSPLISGNKLLLFYAETLLHDGKVEEAVALLKRQLGFSRRLLSMADTLMLKMIAVATWAASVYQLSRFLDNPEFHSHISGFHYLLRPFSPDELSMKKSFRQEFAALYHAMNVGVIEEMKALKNPVLPARQILFKPNHATELSFPFFKKLGSVSQMPLAEFDDNGNCVMSELDFGVMDTAQNFIGVISLKVSLPALQKYYHRVVTAEIVRRLVILKIRYITETVPPADIESFLSKSPGNLRNPYTRHLFEYDEEHKTIFHKHGCTPSQNQNNELHLNLLPVSIPSQP